MTSNNILRRNKTLSFSIILLTITLMVIYRFASTPNKPLPRPIETEQHLATPPITPAHQPSPDEKPNTVPNENTWHQYTVKPNETLSQIFKKLHLPTNDLYKLLDETKGKHNLHHLSSGQELSIALTKNRTINALIQKDNNQQTVIELIDGHYQVKKETIKRESIDAHATITIQTNLIQDVKKAGLPYQYVLKLEKLFRSNINFSRDLRAGDQFTLLYKQYIVNGEPRDFGPILAASFTNKGQTHYAFRFKQKGEKSSYFDPSGKNLSPSFDRLPLKPKRISSRFNTRRMHPVLGYRRPHKGVDLVANTNTPIHAVSDGVIAKIGKNAGYGNMVKIQHNKNFSTLYAHMTRTAKGLKRYSKVKRGQIIGYVGQTGLATAPHCHFELHKNGIAINPQTAKLPLYKSINSKYIISFNQKKNDYMEQLKLLKEVTLSKA